MRLKNRKAPSPLSKCKLTVALSRPYSDPIIVSLDVGTLPTRFEVHGAVLGQSTELAEQASPWYLKKLALPLPDLDDAAAHTLIHYLYTGKYQALKANAQNDAELTLSYKLGTCVYCAAVRYKLPGLGELAKEKITSIGEDISIFDVLAMAKDHGFPLLPEDDTWYPAYLEGAITSAMKSDPEPFRKPDFITKIEGNSRLLQLAWKTVMNYTHAPVAPVTVEDDLLTPTAENMPEEPQDAMYQASELASEAQSTQESDSRSNEVHVPHNTTVEEVVPEISNSLGNSVELEEIEPTVESPPPPPESFTDELDYGKSKTYSQQINGKSIITSRPSINPDIPKVASHHRVDSGIQIEAEDLTPDVESKTTGLADEETPLVVNETTEKSMPKKSKKKKKKGT